jgi:hypothetical protein
MMLAAFLMKPDPRSLSRLVILTFMVHDSF